MRKKTLIFLNYAWNIQNASCVLWTEREDVKMLIALAVLISVLLIMLLFVVLNMAKIADEMEEEKDEK